MKGYQPLLGQDSTEPVYMLLSDVIIQNEARIRVWPRIAELVSTRKDRLSDGSEDIIYRVRLIKSKGEDVEFRKSTGEIMEIPKGEYDSYNDLSCAYPMCYEGYSTSSWNYDRQDFIWAGVKSPTAGGNENTKKIWVPAKYIGRKFQLGPKQFNIEILDGNRKGEQTALPPRDLYSTR
ncbi:hypothetical protein BDN70DRAFT_971713 [Pholiota conissans]|uniref:Uncharacterized protein n=1 Tax=Pholiota conissans TaxID=109636 RepID=A0A9P6D3S1_9AGAR|nr:hypothetical protein BDN70DRAFT_971713 [Pholiota conissans]